MYSTLSTSVHDFPRQTVSVTEKEKPEWIKKNMDFFDYQSAIQEIDKIDDMKILRFLNGEIDSNRFRYVSDPLALGKDKDEEYGTTMEITHFPIVARPINTIVGECIKRPLNFYAKSESSAASNEYFRIKTELLIESANNLIMARIQEIAKREGIDLNTDEGAQFLDAKTPRQVQEYMDKSYVDVAEQVANRILKNLYKREALDLEFVDGFKYGVSIGKEFYHTYVKGGKTCIRNISQDDVFFHKSVGTKWVSEGQYAGIVSYLTPSSLLDLFYDDLTSADIQYIQDLSTGITSSSTNKKPTGEISYSTDVYANYAGHTYAMYQDETNDYINEFYLHGKTLNARRGLIKTIQAYWQTQRKVGFITDAEGIITLVDETVKPNKAIGESIEYKTINHLYEGVKIGENIYKGGPYKYQEFDINDLTSRPLPIEGCYYNNNYTKPIGLVHLMLPWNELYDIVAYELKKDMNSALGKVMFMSIDHLPDIPGFSMEKWYYWARELKIAWVQSPDQRNSFAHFQSADMSFAEQMIAKMKILDGLEQKCNQIAGFSEPRLGNSSAENTLGQSSQSLVASVNQTEYWFFKHSHLVQRVLTNAINLERFLLKNDKTSLRNLYNDVELQHLDMDTIGDRFLNEKIGIYLTNSNEDLRKKEMVNNLMQTAASKGEDYVNILELIMADSISETKNIYQSLKRREDAKYQKEIEMRNKELEAKLAESKADRESREKIATERNNTEIEKEYMRTFSMQKDNLKDTDTSGIADVLEFEKFRDQVETNRAKLTIEMKKQEISEKQLQNAMIMNRENNETKKQISKDGLKNKVSGEK
jgi:hypothetical protein